MSDATLDAWLCKSCNDISPGYNFPSEHVCRWCGAAKPDVVSIHQISVNSPAALELMGQQSQKAGKRGKSASKPKNEASENETKRPTTKELYKRVNWNEFTDNEIVFTVYGKPIAKERPRLGRGGTYTPTKTKDYEKLVLKASQTAMHGIEPLTGLLQLSVAIFRADGIRADIDNILKSILDGMAGAVYINDSQVAELSKVRIVRYASRECVSITVREFAQYPMIAKKKGKAA